MCTNCRDNYLVKATSNEISWQGNDYEDLEVCLNDSLTDVGNIILDKISEFIKGEGIIVEDLTISDCKIISDLLGSNEKSLLNLLDVYKQAICELKTNLDGLSTSVSSFTDIEEYILGCLSPIDPCGDPLTFKSLIQSLITKVCALNTQLEGIAANLLDAIEEGAGNLIINGAITSCGGNGIVYSGSGASAKATFQALVPPNCPIIYTGSLSLFNGSGVGLPNTSMCGWYLCNGSNGTPNSSSLPQNGGGTIQYIIRFT